MSNVSIFEKKWLDIVFENKNKEYGAYQLRRESPKTTLLAFVSGIGFIALISGTALLVSAFGTPKPPVPKPDLTDSIIVHRVILDDDVAPPPPPPPVFPGSNTTNHTTKPIPVPVPTPLADPDPEPNPEPVGNPSEPSGGNGAATGGVSGGFGDTSNTFSTPIPETPAKPVSPNLLDEQPQYPGGIKKFYTYIADHFDNLEIDDLEQITVTLSFVIEKDGSMTNIKVLRNPGYGIDKEAIRVLQSDKAKWKPGVKEGKFVPSLYTIPITVKLNAE